MAGATILALVLGAPQANAEDDVVIFGGEFEDETTPQEAEKPKPVKQLPPPEVRKPDAPKPKEDKPEVKPEVTKPEVKPQAKSEEIVQPDEDDDLGDVLIFDDLSNLPKPEPEQNPLTEPEPEPVVEPLPAEIERPFTRPTEVPDEREQINEPVEIVPPLPIQPIQPEPPVQQPAIQLPQDEPIAETPEPKPEKQKPLKTLKARFVKLAVDDTYTYYLDKPSVQWKKMPYSSSEYIADVWIRMVERKPTALDDDMASYGEENFNAEVTLAREQGYQYSADDLAVLSSQAYVLEHYYLRPKTNQIQFLCELEVFGRPQNTINERAYDYKNWENLVPGSVESVIYAGVIKTIGTKKASDKGHMTFIDMLEEYGRISLR